VRLRTPIVTTAKAITIMTASPAAACRQSAVASQRGISSMPTNNGAWSISQTKFTPRE
jgi:hypothetical protein